MFQSVPISIEKSGIVKGLVKDYLKGKKDLSPFYSYPPDQKGIRDAIRKFSCKKWNREKLFSALTRQTERVGNTTNITRQNISSLKNENSFTVVTGHQLCLFTGPLYFIHKIFSVISITEQLKMLHRENNFIPVYWMAGEDHDIEEIDHLHVFGKKVHWHSHGKGAVGDLTTEGLSEVLDQLRMIWGNSSHANELALLFERSYLQHGNLKDATRFLVNELFGEYGLVVIDGDDKELKKDAQHLFRADFFESIPLKYVSETSNLLRNLGYEPQVNPREVNCFYKTAHLRERIEKTHDGFKVLEGGPTFSKEEIERIILEQPENLSPNVVLRPLYQQCILPNIMYVGGPGELAYWLQYKSMFERMNQEFPVLMMRSSFSFIDKNAAEKLARFGISDEELFEETPKIIKNFMERQGNTFDVVKEKRLVEEELSGLRIRMAQIDKTLESTVSAEIKKCLDMLDGLAAKANRALKNREEFSIQQIKNIREKIRPGDKPQERTENFSSFYLKYGKELMNHIRNAVQPFDPSHILMKEI